MQCSTIFSDYKSARLLNLYTKLIQGAVINKTEEADRFGVHQRTIQRDIEDLRAFFENQNADGEVKKNLFYDKSLNCYYLCTKDDSSLSNSEILAVCKILLDSRSLCKSEMESIITKMINACVPKENQKIVKSLINNEMFHYVEPRHKKRFIDKMWDIGQAILSSNYIEIEYTRTKDKAVVRRKLKPAAIMFSEYYFYLTAFIDDENVKQDFDVLNDSFPTIYRIDKIKKLTKLDEKFYIPYMDKFEEGEFRKRIQFMYGGKIERIKFQYLGTDVDAILDRLPTAKIISEEDGIYTIMAEVFGKGIDMWLRSQGEMVKVCR